MEKSIQRVVYCLGFRVKVEGSGLQKRTANGNRYTLGGFIRATIRDPFLHNADFPIMLCAEIMMLAHTNKPYASLNPRFVLLGV